MRIISKKILIILLIFFIFITIGLGSRSDASEHLSVSVFINADKIDYFRNETIKLSYIIKHQGGNKGDWDPINEDFINIKIPKNFSFPDKVNVFRDNKSSTFYYLDIKNRSLKIPLNHSANKLYITNVSYKFDYLKNYACKNAIDLGSFVERPKGLGQPDFKINHPKINITNRPPKITCFSPNPYKLSICPGENLTFLCKAEDMDGHLTKWVILDRYDNGTETHSPVNIDNNSSKLTYVGQDHKKGLHLFSSIVYDSDYVPSQESDVIRVEIREESINRDILWILTLCIITFIILLGFKSLKPIPTNYTYLIFMILGLSVLVSILLKDAFILINLTYFFCLIISIYFISNALLFSRRMCLLLLIWMLIAFIMVLYANIDKEVLNLLIGSFLSVVLAKLVNDPNSQKNEKMKTIVFTLFLIFIYYCLGYNIDIDPLSSLNSYFQAISIISREIFILLIGPLLALSLYDRNETDQAKKA